MEAGRIVPGGDDLPTNDAIHVEAAVPSVSPTNWCERCGRGKPVYEWR